VNTLDGPWDSAYHAPVLVAEVADALGGATSVFDGTLGGGGHAAALLAAGRRVDAVDRDPEAVADARARLAVDEAAGRFRAFVGNFAALNAVPALRGVRYDGILLDLGLSSHQLNDFERGFSFRPGAPLDMRMDGPHASAADEQAGASAVLTSASESELAGVFREYGDEPRSARLAREIVRRRTTRPFAISDDLVGAIRGALGPRTGPADFARLFQALRIAVNDELSALATALPELRDRLTPQGRMVVIAYHSGEDRIVKHAFREWSRACRCPPRQPRCTCGGQALGSVVTRRAVMPGPAEVAANSRARSARLRIWQRAA
jgi:16S rRNA (cytosine1402-N4)-methyltransferase